MKRLLLPVLGASLALGACTAHDTLQTASIGGAPRAASLDALLDGNAVRPERQATPVAVLPAWMGRPIRLRERDDADAFEQVVSLADAPRGEARENLVMLTMPRSRAALDRLEGGAASVMGKPTEAGIRAELEAVLPGTPMQVVARPASNAYGPYGLAVGRSGSGARCLYAWQWIESRPTIEAGAGGPLSLRVRLCRGDVTLEAMAAAVNQMRLVPRFEGAPVASAVAARQANPAPRADRRGNASRHAHADRTARRHSEPPITATVPAYAAAPVAAMPAPDLSGRRYLGGEPAPAPSYRPAAMPSGPMRGVPVGLAGLNASAAAPSGGLTADLPPEAYRGPASGPTGNRP